jgi:arginyl-tRNA synthetase
VHLRFFFMPKNVPKLILTYIDDRKEQYGIDANSGVVEAAISNSARKKAVVEYSSPNLASEFTAAHLRSTLIGSQIAKLYQGNGWDVIQLNYLGEWGKQLGLLAVGWHRFGSEELFHQDPMGHLLEVYEKIEEQFRPEKEASKRARDEGHDTAAIESQGIFAERDGIFKRMEEGDPEAIDLWKRFRDVSIDYYTHAYARLGISFDEYSGESMVSAEAIEEVESALKKKGVYEESEGSWIIDYKKHCTKNLGTAIVRGRTGSSTYLLRDVAAVIDRYRKYSFDKMLYVVSSEQDAHFHRVFQTLRLMGRDDLADKLEHVNFGRVQGMSPQLGRVRLLGDILDQTVSAMHDALGTEQDQLAHFENTEASARLLGITALVTQDAHTRRATSYTFSTTKLASFDGDTGPRLQAIYAKLCAKIKESDPAESVLANVTCESLHEEPWLDVLRLLAQYPDVVHSAFNSHEPSLIMAYLFRLTAELDDCLYDDDEDDEPGEPKTEPPETESPEAILAQAVLYKQARQVLDNGMAILGLTPITV